MSKVVSYKEPSKFMIIAAFTALYIIWGSTYLSISIAIKSIPPFFMVAARYLMAGVLLCAWCMFKGEKFPTSKNFVTIGIGGFLMLFMGNGAVTLAEQYLPSGLAAIIVATVPLWFIILDKRNWNHYFSNKIIIVGILLGFAGVLMLFSGKGSLDFSGDKMKVAGFFILIVGSICWAMGSLYSKYKQVEGSTSMKAAVQMLAAGLVALLTGFVSNEQHGFVVSNITHQSIFALLYLVIMGSLIGYMSYIWLLSVLPASRVGTYAYVNPVVAVFLGWLIANEAITSQQVIALVVILLGVILVNAAKDQKKAVLVEKMEIEDVETA